MTQVTIHEAKTHLSRLIQRVLEGEEIIIARGRQPLVKMVVVADQSTQRRIGGASDAVLYIAPDFDAPLEDLREYMQ